MGIHRLLLMVPVRLTAGDGHATPRADGGEGMPRLLLIHSCRQGGAKCSRRATLWKTTEVGSFMPMQYGSRIRAGSGRLLSSLPNGGRKMSYTMQLQAKLDYAKAQEACGGHRHGCLHLRKMSSVRHLPWCGCPSWHIWFVAQVQGRCTCNCC